MTDTAATGGLNETSGKTGSDTAKINANGGGVLTPDTAYLTEVSLDLHGSRCIW